MYASEEYVSLYNRFPPIRQQAIYYVNLMHVLSPQSSHKILNNIH